MMRAWNPLEGENNEQNHPPPRPRPRLDHPLPAVRATCPGALADWPGDLRRRLCRRRQFGHQCPRAGSYHVAGSRPADHRRQQGRRHRLDRPARRGQRQARRLHAVLRRRHQRRHQPACPEGHDRYHRQPGADLPDDVLPVRAGGEPQGAGQQRGRACGAGQEGTGEAHLFVLGSRRQQSSRGRAVRRDVGHPAHPRALQGNGPGTGRCDQRADHHEFLLAAAGRQPDQGRQRSRRWR